MKKNYFILNALFLAFALLISVGTTTAKPIAKSITKINECKTPYNLTITELTHNSVTITWETGFVGLPFEAPSCEPYYREKGETEWLSDFFPMAGMNEQTYSDLKPNTTYEFRVRCACQDWMSFESTTEYSEWAYLEFTTEPMPEVDPCTFSDIPYVEDFENAYRGSMPTCWKTYYSDYVSKYKPGVRGESNTSYQDENGNAVGGYNCLGFGLAAPAKDTRTVAYLIMPPVDKAIDITKLQLSAWFVKRSINSYQNAIMEIGFLKTPEDTASFVLIDTVPIMAVDHNDNVTVNGKDVNVWHYFTFPFSQYKGEGRYLAFRQTYGYNNEIDIDDVSIEYPENENCPDPKNLTISNIKSKSAKLTWEADKEAKSWTIEYKAEEGEWISKEVADLEFVFEDLTPKTKYDVRVKASCADADSRWVTTYFTTQVSCPAPTDLVTNVVKNSVELSWTPQGEETSWEVKLYATSGEPFIDTVYEAKYARKDLEPERQYDAYIKALCSETEFSQNLWGNFFTQPTCPSPKNLKLNEAELTTTSASFTWEPGGDETEWRIVAKGTSFDYYLEDKVTEPAYKLEKLEQGTEYMFSVIALCEDETSKNSTDAVFTTILTCPAPTDPYVEMKETSDTSISFAWDAGGEEKAWDLQYRKASDKWTSIIVEDKPAYIITGLEANTTYELRVRAICGEGDTSKFVNTKATTKEPACVAPTNLTYTDITASSATLNWEAGNQETAWILQYKAASDEIWSKNIDVEKNSYTLTDLAAATTYNVRVAASCGKDNNSDWTEGEFTTAEAAVDTCVAPTDVKVDSITKNSAVVTWSQAEGTANEWEVRYRKDGATEWDGTLTVSETKATLTELTPETAYEVDVTAHCVNGVNSDPTAPVPFKTIPDAVNDYVLNSSINLFPNPTTGVITCNVKDLNVERVEVYDVYGKLLNAFNTNESVIRIDASSFANGLYFVRICTEQGNANKTFIKK